MSITTIVAFWAVSILFVITPGADWAYAIAAGLRHRRIFPAIAGLLAGHLMATIIVALGVAAVISRTPVVLLSLTVAGSLYLIWLGIGAIAKPPEPQMGRETTGDSSFRQALRGFGISGLNPKVFLLFLALLPQFTDPAASLPVAVQIVVFGLIHTISCGVVYTAVATGARKVLQTRPAAARAISRFSGAAMVVIGIVLLAEQFTNKS